MSFSAGSIFGCRAGWCCTFDTLAGTEAVQPLTRAALARRLCRVPAYSRRLCRQTYSAWLQNALGQSSKIEITVLIFKMVDSCIAFAGTAGANRQARGKADAPAPLGLRVNSLGASGAWIASAPAGPASSLCASGADQGSLRTSGVGQPRRQRVGQPGSLGASGVKTPERNWMKPH